MADYALRLSDDEVARYRLMAEHARAHESELWARAGLGPGARIADVGCGPGAILALLAEAVGSEGEVVGLDSDESAVAAASALIASTGLTNASVRVGKADDTGLPEAGFDVVMMRHVLAHNGGAEQRIVDHLATLVRPGGALYLVDAHLQAIAMYPTGRAAGPVRPVHRIPDRQGQRSANRPAAQPPGQGRRTPCRGLPGVDPHHRGTTARAGVGGTRRDARRRRHRRKRHRTLGKTPSKHWTLPPSARCSSPPCLPR